MLRILLLAVVLLATPVTATRDVHLSQGTSCHFEEEEDASESWDGSRYETSWSQTWRSGCEGSTASVSYEEDGDERAGVSVLRTSWHDTDSRSAEGHLDGCTEHPQNASALCASGAYDSNGSHEFSSSSGGIVEGHARGHEFFAAVRSCDHESASWDRDEWRETGATGTYDAEGGGEGTAECRGGILVDDAGVLLDECSRSERDDWTSHDDYVDGYNDHVYRHESRADEACSSRVQAAGEEVEFDACSTEETYDGVWTYKDGRFAIDEESTTTHTCATGLDERRDVAGEDVALLAQATTVTTTRRGNGPSTTERDAGASVGVEAAGVSTGRHDVALV